MSLFIGNLPENSSRELLEEEFSKFGKCQVNYFGKFAFVEYQLETEAEEARLTWDSQEFYGQTLKVEISQIAPGNKGLSTRALPEREEGEEVPDQNPPREALSEQIPFTAFQEQDHREKTPVEQSLLPRTLPHLANEYKFDIVNDKGIEEMMKAINEPQMATDNSKSPQVTAHAEEVIKKTGKRGRPRKVVEEGSEAALTTNPNSDEPKVPKKRGRPRKVPLAEGEEPPKKTVKAREIEGISLSIDDDDDDHINAPRASRTRRAREVQPIREESDSEVEEDDDESPMKKAKGSDRSSDYSPKSDAEERPIEKELTSVIAEDGTVFKRSGSKYMCPACNKGIMLNSINTHVKSSLHKRHKPS